MARPHTKFGRGQKRSSVWIAPADQGLVAVSGAAKVLLASTAGFGLGSAGTVVRSRGILQVSPQATSGSLTHDGAFGLAVVSATAVATGITAIPGPFTDADWAGWYVHQFTGGVWDVGSDIGAQYAQIQWEIDSKAMRKVSGDEALVFVYEFRLGSVNVLSHVRQLFKLA